ncbi:MAG: branched-chain amino acid ABC transporter permease [Eubacteriales bacterium]|jgi:branched-chain amino acid transport system permease protein
MKSRKECMRASVINLVAVVALYALLMLLMQTGVINSYYKGILMLILVNIVLAVSLNITTGFLGQIALGHAGFMSIGAYAAGLLAKAVGEPQTGNPAMDMALSFGIFVVSLLVGGILAAVVGLAMGIPSLRLKGDYLAIITLGFCQIIKVIIEYFDFTGGAQGLKQIPKLAAFSWVFWVTVLIVAVLFTFVRSRFGRAIMAIREDDIASEACGIHNTYYKVLAFVVSAFFAGVAGAMYALFTGLLSAAKFDFNKSVDILVFVVLGGMGSLTGSVLAATGLTILPEALREFSDYRMVIYSVALILMMIFKPSGLLGRYEFSLTRLVDRVTGRGGKMSGPKARKEAEKV